MTSTTSAANTTVSHRIVTLLPSATEIVCALGFESSLVGRSHECDYPPSVTQLPILTESKFNPEGDSATIDTRVKTVLQEALSVYRVHADLLAELAPDMIVTQSQCEVCAVSFDEVQRVACDTLGTDAHIVSLEPNALSDVLADFQRVADALGAPERGAALVAHIRAGMAAISAETHNIPDKPTVALIEWLNPLMAAGNWMPELVEMAGGINLFGKAGEHSPWMQWEDLRGADPDVIVLLPCGFDIARTRSELDTVTRLEGWSELRAVRSGRVYITDGNAYFNRPGPRLLESLEILAEILNPETFQFGHQGTGWEFLS
jgi:iron complex transport system substrate-binding protein